MILRGLILSSVVLLGGCASFWNWGGVPEGERRSYNQKQGQPRAQAAPAQERTAGAGEYMVHPGDTMYSIAFRNQLDFRELARWNGIGSDYLIHPGQVLRLTPPSGMAGDGVVAAAPEAIPPPSAIPAQPSVRREPIPLPVEPPKRVIGEAPPLPVPSAMSPPPVSPTVPAVQPVQAAVPPVQPPAPLATESGGPYRWQWPTDGVVVREFNPAAGSKGLDFSGSVGQAVVAAAPGKVVYSGAALKGYGELIIIKHDDLRLSAYAYNRTRLVEDGAMVKGGQKIAELGLGPENKPVLHFEIRERGQPVNPASYLPPKN